MLISAIAGLATYASGTGTTSETWTYIGDAFGRVVRVIQDRGGTVWTTTATYDGEGQERR